MKDSDPEEVRIQLYYIIRVLDKINAPDEKREVETVHNQLFSPDGQEHLAAKELSTVLETKDDAAEECSIGISDELSDSKTMIRWSEASGENEVEKS